MLIPPEPLGIITEPGIYDLPPEQYHGQPCNTLSMSSTNAVTLTEATPQHLLASWADPDDSSKQADLGTVIHLLLLEPHRRESALSIVDAKTWQGGAAKEAKAEAIGDGKLPVLRKDIERAQAAVDAVMENPVAAALLSEGEAERSWFARDKATGLYRKARPDFFTKGRVIVDIKSVGSAAPTFLERRVYDGAWFQQAPWYCDVVEQVQGEPAAGYCWIIVEQKPPHAVVVRRPTEPSLIHGHRLNQEAFAKFAHCALNNDWPAYGNAIEDLGLPSFAYYRLEEQAMASESKGMEAVRLSAKTGAHVFS